MPNFAVLLVLPRTSKHQVMNQAPNKAKTDYFEEILKDILFNNSNFHRRYKPKGAFSSTHFNVYDVSFSWQTFQSVKGPKCSTCTWIADNRQLILFKLFQNIKHTQLWQQLIQSLNDNHLFYTGYHLLFQFLKYQRKEKKKERKKKIYK